MKHSNIKAITLIALILALINFKTSYSQEVHFFDFNSLIIHNEKTGKQTFDKVHNRIEINFEGRNEFVKIHFLPIGEVLYFDIVDAEVKENDMVILYFSGGSVLIVDKQEKTIYFIDKLTNKILIFANVH